MKILFDATELSYFEEKSGHRGGIFVVALNLLREFKKLGVDITLACNFKRYYFLKNLIKNNTEFSEFELLEEHSPINKFFGLLNYVVRNSSRKIIYGILRFSRYYENIFYKKNKDNINELKQFDVFFSPFTPPSEEILSSKHLKRFMMLHDIIPILENDGKTPKNPQVWSYRLYNTINPNDFYLTNSEHTKRDFLKTFPFIKKENIKTAYLGANSSFKPLKRDTEEKYIFSLCTLGKRKNLIFSIRNFFKFIEKNKIEDLKLVLAGGIWKNFEKELYKTIGEFDKSKVELLGYVDDEELPKLYSNALCFIYPSLYEGFGLPVLEAMSSGCPVITSNTSSLPEVIGECGIKINPTDDNEMVEALERMYYDNIFRALCSERGLERAKEFSWEKCAQEIIDFINDKKYT